MAVISLGFLSVLIWPTTRPPCSEHQAESLWNGEPTVV